MYILLVLSNQIMLIFITDVHQSFRSKGENWTICYVTSVRTSNINSINLTILNIDFHDSIQYWYVRHYEVTIAKQRLYITNQIFYYYALLFLFYFNKRRNFWYRPVHGSIDLLRVNNLGLCPRLIYSHQVKLTMYWPHQKAIIV